MRLSNHITAVGADTKQKQELDTHVLQKADILVTDSIDQSVQIGEFAYAIDEGEITQDKVKEFGTVIIRNEGRECDDEITVMG